MHIVHRLLSWLFILAAYAFVGHANADEYQPRKSYTVSGNNFESCAQAGEFRRQQIFTQNGCGTSVQFCPTTVTIVKDDFTASGCTVSTNASNYSSLGISGAFHCDHGGSLQQVAGQWRCINVPPCPPGYNRDQYGECQPPPVDCNSKTGQVALEGEFGDSDGDGALTPLTCVSSCQAGLAETRPGQPSCSFGSSGVGSCFYTIFGLYRFTGAQCAGSEGSPDAAPPAQPDCPQCDCFAQGGSYSTVNGVGTCVPQGTPGSPPVQTQLPPKVETVTPPATPENPNPEPVTTTTPGPVITIIPPATPGAEPEVEKTETGPNGTTTTRQPKGQFCEENPNAKICGDGEDDMFAGSCESGFTCSGDVIMCAMAKKQHQDRCDDINELSQYTNAITKGEELLAGQYGDEVDAYINGTDENTQTINLPDALSETGQATFGAAGLSDISVGFQGQTITLPLSKLNTVLEMLGFIILACAYITALRIVGVF